MGSVIDRIVPQRYWAWAACALGAVACLAAAPLSPPSELGPEHVIRRVSSNEVRSLSALHPWLRPGELLDDVPSSPVYQVFWKNARPDTFTAPPSVLTVKTGKSR